MSFFKRDYPVLVIYIQIFCARWTLVRVFKDSRLTKYSFLLIWLGRIYLEGYYILGWYFLFDNHDYASSSVQGFYVLSDLILSSYQIISYLSSSSCRFSISGTDSRKRLSVILYLILCQKGLRGIYQYKVIKFFSLDLLLMSGYISFS